jgi:hypothetical protein
LTVRLSCVVGILQNNEFPRESLFLDFHVTKCILCTMSTKAGGKTNQLVLGFCLGTLITIVFSLMTWGSVPTPKRIGSALVLMFLCGIYPMWCLANRAGVFFNVTRSRVFVSRCIALLILISSTTLLGMVFWPPPPLIAMQISPSVFPVSVPPHSVVSILRIHPYVGLTDSDDWLLKDSNDSDKEYFWPSQQEVDSKDQNAHEGVYRIAITNHSQQTLMNGKLSFQLQYSPGALTGCKPSTDSVKREDVVLIPQLDPGKSFDFYAINQSNLCAWLIPPDTATVRMTSDETERQAPLTFDKNPLYNSGAPNFMPTKIKWEGLPTTAGPHYQVQRITH